MGRRISTRIAAMQPAYNAEKLRELMLYVAQRCTEDKTYGATKLNKILFFSDFIAYAELGVAITGASYQKLDKGPAPRALVPILEEMKSAGEAVEVKKSHYNFQQRRVVALRDPDLSAFSPEEIALVDRVIQAFWGRTASNISDFSHRLTGWMTASLREDIPYQTAFLSERKPDAADIERGQEIAREHGWVS